MKTRTIAIGSQKGGVGKTTTVVNLAAWLALLKQKVLIIDFDPQASTTRCLGLHGKTERGGIKEIFELGALELLKQKKYSAVYLRQPTGKLISAAIEYLELRY